MSGKFEIVNMDMKMGSSLKIKGKIADGANGFGDLQKSHRTPCAQFLGPNRHGSSNFVINLGQGTDKLNLHFNPRFGESTIVCNSRDGNSWGAEQRDNHMCFSPGSEVKLIVTFENNEFKVKLPDGHQLTFPNRLGHSHLSYLGVQNFIVSSFKLE